MAHVKCLDPGASPLHFFGSELRRLRERAGLTLAQLGDIVYLTGSMIGQVETAAKVPKDEHVPRIDAALGADGALVRLWGMVKRYRLPVWLRRIVHFEATALEIRTYQAQLVHGLLQTPDYARAVLGVLRQDELAARLETRLERQEVLAREAPPLLWVVLDESVLYREIGGRATMSRQLEHLLTFRETDEVQIQVLPFSVGAHTGLSGSFTLFTFDGHPDVAYAEGYVDDWASLNSEEIRTRSLRYDLLRASALSPADSADLIARVMEERYEHRPEHLA
ncbi:helix-turn-helix domain-containing protein [Streptomyces purpurogeneiscleroticus]|uniref:helix-turn-helix domain-containing protein n=1 Tax=Streptomyces purpurogeneiscleroticus TaxID=68259 RepID=UPI001CC07F93|nr:helix-turn-helix transcriptional regulator [Streptomyces purpurogeneiscleroticus]MBZ4019439.1 transcriptional regulator [Streptomyces purpurogeneiscleroticus]